MLLRFPRCDCPEIASSPASRSQVKSQTPNPNSRDRFPSRPGIEDREPIQLWMLPPLAHIPLSLIGHLGFGHWSFRRVAPACPNGLWGLFYQIASFPSCSIRSGFSARMGSGVFSTRLVSRPVRLFCSEVSVPEWALGSFLPRARRSVLTRSPAEKFQCPNGLWGLFYSSPFLDLRVFCLR